MGRPFDGSGADNAPEWQHADLLRAVLQAAPAATVAVDPEGKVRVWNQAAQRLLGWSAAEVLGRPCPLGGQQFRQLQARALQGEMLTDQPLAGKRRDGAGIGLKCSLAPVRGPEGRMLGVVLQLAEAPAIPQVRTGAEAGAGIAHELGQPLGAVLNYVNACVRFLTAAEGSPPGVLEGLRAAAAQAARATEIVRRWRNLVRRGAPERSPADVNRLVEESLALLNDELRRSGAALRLGLAGQLPPIWCDPVQIQQVILNLVRNALDALHEVPSGRRALIVETAASQAGAVEVRVGDTGPGLEPEMARRLFEPFVTSKPTGMGLGLTICRTIIESHGGRLRAERNPENGVTFHFTLPTGTP
jgi:two-component system sensor kinase FixL